MTSIRCELNALIADVSCSRNSNVRGFLIIFSTLFFALLGATGAEILADQFATPTWCWRLLAVFWIGTRLRALSNIIHECSHGIFVRSPKYNVIFGHALAAFDLTSFTEYTREHRTHHASVGEPGDLDLRPRFVLFNQPTMSRAIALIVLYCLLLLPLWKLILRPIFWDRKAPLWSNVLRLIIISFIVLTCCLPETRSLSLTYLVVPYLTSYQWMRIFSDACDHLSLIEKKEKADRSRNHLFGPQCLNYIFFPRQDGYHLLHHLFPTLPTKDYPKIHALLLLHPWYCAKKHSILNFIPEKKIRDLGLSALQGHNR